MIFRYLIHHFFYLCTEFFIFLMDNSISYYYNEAIDFVLGFLPQVLQTVIILWLGFWAIGKLTNRLRDSMTRTTFSKEVRTSLISTIDLCLKVILVFFAVAWFGFDTASFVAVMVAVGFVVGMALQGSLGNFAAGIIVLLFKPYQEGDWIELDGKFGKVSEIHLFYTNVITPGKKKLIIPNGEMISGVVTNYSDHDYIRIEQEVMIPYSEDFPKVREIIYQVLKKIDKVVEDPQPEIGILRFDSNSVVISVRPYVLPDDYWDVYYQSMADIKTAFSENEIGMAYTGNLTVGKIGK
jgi:small conductance mechanosensitive channel